MEDRVAHGVLLELDLGRRLGGAVGLVAVQEERVRVLVVHEQQPLARALEREVGEEVVVEPVVERASLAVPEGVAPGDQHLRPEALGHLEGVAARRGDRLEVAEAARAPLREGLLGEQVEAGALQRHRAGGARSGGRDPADEVTSGGSGQLAPEGALGGFAAVGDAEAGGHVRAPVIGSQRRPRRYGGARCTL